MERRTHTTMEVLRVLLRQPTADHYGLELARAAGVRSTSVYPVLIRLEADGWLSSHWEDIDEAAEGRRKRKYFRLTGEGVRVGRVALAEWDRERTPQPRGGRRRPGMAGA